MNVDYLVEVSAIFIYSKKIIMKGFRQPKEPSKAELKKIIQRQERTIRWLDAQVELYKKIAMRLRNCKDMKELEELRKAMQEAKEAVIFAEKREDWKLYDPKTWEELETNQEYDENAEEINQATEENSD